MDVMEDFFTTKLSTIDVCYREILSYLPFEDQWRAHQAFPENKTIIGSIKSLLKSRKTIIRDSDLNFMFNKRYIDRSGAYLMRCRKFVQEIGEEVRVIEVQRNGKVPILTLAKAFPFTEQLTINNCRNADIRCIMARMPNLRKLDISLFNLKTTIWLERHEQLESLTMEIKAPSESCLAQLGTLTKLKGLSLDLEYISELEFLKLCQSVNHLKSLKLMSGPSVEWQHSIFRQSLLNLSNVEELRIIFNSAVGPYDYLADLPQLTKLDIHDLGPFEMDKNLVVKLIQKQPQILKCLKYHGISWFEAAGQVFAPLQSLEYLYLECSTINPKHLDVICSCFPNLKQLELDIKDTTPIDYDAFYAETNAIPKYIIQRLVSSLEHLEKLKCCIFSNPLCNFDHLDFETTTIGDYFLNLVNMLKERQRQKQLTIIVNSLFPLEGLIDPKNEKYLLLKENEEFDERAYYKEYDIIP